MNTEPMRIAITGAGGMLGTAVMAYLKPLEYEILATSFTAADGLLSLDIKDIDSVRRLFSDFKPNLILHLAAETDVDLCEKEPDHAYFVNTLGTENIALAALECEATLVYISTGNVFDGTKSEPHIEYDRPNPINVYGMSKWQGERCVERLLDKYFILRAGWMVGGWEIDKKFVYKMVELCRSENQLQVVDDKFGSPTFTVDFAANLMRVVESKRYGLYHMSNDGTGSRFDIANQIVKNLGLQGEVTVLPVSSAEFPMPASRPRSEMIRNYKLEQLGLNGMPHWKESLARYIEVNRGNWARG